MKGVHIVQSPEWALFKNQYGTKAVRSGDTQFTIHKIPFTQYYYAYCPKVNPFFINWELLKKDLNDNNCIAINFDVPNIVKTSSDYNDAQKIFTEKCESSPKDTFARFNILLDISQSEEQILSNMHKKHRYNLRYSQKKGVTVREGSSTEDFEKFYALLKETSIRQKYYIHPEVYYQKIWEVLHPLGICHILLAEFNGKALAAWMLFVYEDTLYYPYGGSSVDESNVFPSTLVCWESIRLGKAKGCKVFDMWGAAEDPTDTTDPWYGFTNFKLKFGGKHVEYMNSFDYIINGPAYSLFNFANDMRWKVLNLLK